MFFQHDGTVYTHTLT